MSLLIATIVLSLFAFPTILWLLSYLVPILIVNILPVPNLKKKYKAEWALVTGGSSGIGRSVAVKLASQGLNVVVVALGDQLLKDTVALLQENFPNQSFRAVECNFSPGQPYLEAIKKATKDIDVQIIFNNAGYIVTGLFDQTKLEKQLANMECNATAAVAITYHFMQDLIKKKLKGCIVFTSSVAGYIPTPFSCLYGSTKALLSQFACSLAIEARPCGIDVCCIHPPPVNTNFYNDIHKIEMLQSAQRSAISPDEMPNHMFKSIGRVVLRDVGAFSVMVRMVANLTSYNFLTQVFGMVAPFMPDFKKYHKDRL